MISGTTKAFPCLIAFFSHTPSLTGPAGSGLVVAPADALPLPEANRVLFIGAGGSLTVDKSGVMLGFDAVEDGALLPLRVAGTCDGHDSLAHRRSGLMQKDATFRHSAHKEH